MRAEFIGYQEDIDPFPPFALFNIDWASHPKDKSTVDVEELRVLGIPVPAIPQYKDWQRGRK